jgi:uncharacterized protein (TIGR02217 family)
VVFWEQEFPTPVGFQAVGGPGFSTAVNLGFSGQEQRNRNWAKARGKWTISLKTPSKDQWSGTHQAFIDTVIAFFTNVGGQADAFRFKDHKDFQARSQPLQLNAGGALQLARTRTLGGRSYVQFISKPITSSVTNYKGVALPNTVFLAGTSTPVAVDYTTGIVTGQTVGDLVDFDYHYPCRLGSDDLQFQVQEALISEWGSIQLVECLPPNY